MKITSATIEHGMQRYPTVGDWWFENGNLLVFVSSMQNEDYEFLVSIHEQIEAYLCRKNNVSEEEVSAFDIKFEEGRVEGNVDEPGCHPLAPYFHEHAIATKVERLLAECMGVDWDGYDKAVNKL
jgi:hypothetical protein